MFNSSAISKISNFFYIPEEPKGKSDIVFQVWVDALEAHSAYSTHYCSQEQGSEEEEEEVMSLEELKDSLQVAVNEKYWAALQCLVFLQNEGPGPPNPALLSFTCSLLSSLCHQAAEASRKKLEEEMAAFLSMLKDDGLAESKTSYLIIYEHNTFVLAPIFHKFKSFFFLSAL